MLRPARLTEWLKLALDEPELLEYPGRHSQSRRAGVRARRCRQGHAWCAPCVRDRRLVELDGPEVGALRAEDRLASVASAVDSVRDGGGVLLITDIDALLPSTADPVSTLILAELRSAVATQGVAFVATSATARRCRSAVAGARPVRPRARAEPARRHDAQAAARGVVARRACQGSEPRRNRRTHTGFRGRRSERAGARGRAAGSGEGQRGRETADPDPGRPDGCAERDPPAVAVRHRRSGGRLGDARRRRRHGRDQAGAHRIRAVAAAASGDLRAARRRAAAWRAAVRSARLRQDVHRARAGQLRTAVGACGQGRRADGQVGRRIGEGGARIVPPGPRFRAVPDFSRRDRRARAPAWAELRLRRHRPGGGRRC